MANAAPPPSFSHPRRRAASPSMNPDTLLESLANMSIRKGTTFHAPAKNDSELLDPFANTTLAVPRSMTSRSTTCPKELEDLLVGAGERRTLDFLAKVDEAVNNKSKEQLGSILSEPDVLPVPAFFLEGSHFVNSLPDDLEDQAYDSGLGSSISSEGTIKIEGEEDQKTTNKTRKSSRTGSAITRSISGASETEPKDILSHFAVIQIHRYIIKPILAEQALKDFHPLIAQVPVRIGDKHINNLRDLEKTLIFLAPIRRYAQILAANRERQAKGEDVDDMDVTPSPLEIRDGMTQTGRPAQLGYRSKDQVISLANDQPLPDTDVVVSTKRPMSDVVDDDGVHRSMARRKKGELPKTYTCPVADCDKQFNRPCDRTKHLKTHERPHKCQDAACEFSTKGFPTEKERDRHWSDRHDPNAKTWECQFKDSDNCPYSSKREHNLKSHMEKAHGWEYVRSKGVKNSSKPVVSTGKKAKAKAPVRPRPSAASSSSASTPFTYSDASPIDTRHPSSYSPNSPYSAQIDPSPVESLMDYNPTNFNPEFADHFNTNLFGDNPLAIPQMYPYTPSLSDGRRPSHFSSSNGTPVMTNSGAMLGNMTFGDIPTTIPPTPEDLDFSNSLFTKDWDFNADSAMMGCDDFSYGDNSDHLIAPNAFEFQDQAHPALRNDLTFTTTQNYNMPADEGFGGDATFENGQDFQLDQYLSNTGVNEPLFNDNTGFGEMGSQFSLDKPVDSNPYKNLFPELN